jgi:hypothetical protein
MAHWQEIILELRWGEVPSRRHLAEAIVVSPAWISRASTTGLGRPRLVAMCLLRAHTRDFGAFKYALLVRDKNGVCRPLEVMQRYRRPAWSSIVTIAKTFPHPRFQFVHHSCPLLLKLRVPTRTYSPRGAVRELTENPTPVFIALPPAT